MYIYYQGILSRFSDIFLRALNFFCNLAVLVELLLRIPVQQSADAVCRRFTLFQFETIENYDHRMIEIFLLNFEILLLIEVEIVRSSLFVTVIGFFHKYCYLPKCELFRIYL